MRKYFLLLIIALLASSCEKDKGGGGETHLYIFLPRKVAYIRADILKQMTKYYPDGKPYTDYNFLEEENVRKGEWRLSVITANFNPRDTIDANLYRTLVDTPIPEVERLLAQDYESYYFKPSSSSLRNSESAYLNMINIDYRISTIRNLTIRTLHTSLFGKQAGESLNDFFNIVSYNPAIITTPNYRLIYGYADQKSVSIPVDEWLSMLPLAEIGMSMAPNTSVTGLPLDVQFVVEMETDEGLVLRDTTRMFTITE